MTTLAAGTIQKFVANVRGQTFTVVKNSGSLVNVTGDAGTHSLSSSPRRRTFGPLDAGQSITVEAALGDVIVEFGSVAPGSTGGAAVATVGPSQVAAGGPVTSPAIQKIRRAMAAAKTSNGAINPVVSDSFTLTAPTTVDVSLTQTVLVNPSLHGSRMNLFGGVWTANGNGYAPVTDTGVGTGGVAYSNFGIAQLEFVTDAPIVAVGSAPMLIASGTSAMVYVDGKPLNSTGVEASTSGSTRFFQIDWAGVRKRRTYRVIFNAAVWVGRVVIDASATLTAPSRDGVVRGAFEGDSIRVGTMSATAAGAWQTYTMQLAERIGCRDAWIGAQGGTGWCNDGFPTNNNTNTVVTRLGWIAACTPDFAAVNAGRNDATYTAAQIRAAVTAWLTGVRAANPVLPIIVGGAHTGTTAGDDTLSTAVEVAIREAVTTAADAFAAFMAICTATDPPISAKNSALYKVGTNVHPNVAGALFLGAWEAEALPNAFLQLAGAN